MADEKWKDVTFNIPSLLPLQAPPQEIDHGKMLNYIQALHNYLADDRQKLARAINVLAYYRNLFGIYDDQPVASNSMALYIALDTGEAYVDTDRKSGVPTWEPLVAGSVALGGDKIAVLVIDKTVGPPPTFDSFVWDSVSGDIVYTIEYR